MFQYKSLNNQDTVSVTFEQPTKGGNSQRRAAKSPLLWIIISVVVLICVLVLSVALGVGLRNHTLPQGHKKTTDDFSSQQKLIPTHSVKISCGSVKGVKEKGAYVFKGIPYASPPVSTLRWKPPQKMKRCAFSDSPLPVTSYGHKCPQITEKGDIEGNEDCLNINVWTPKLDTVYKLPVMVWFHDGGLIRGSADEINFHDIIDVNKPDHMEAVFVSFNYRLNVFGFLALKELLNGTTGNFGLMDQIMALEWVQENIGQFGGDKNQVTVFGEEAGATCIYALLASSKAKGLFHKAWISGFSPIINTTLEEAYQDNQEVIQKIGCKGKNTTGLEMWKCLESNWQLSIMHIMLKMPKWNSIPDHVNDLPTLGEKMSKMIVIDGEILKYSPLDLWSEGKCEVDVPLLIGNEAQEVDDNPTPKDLRQWDWSKYTSYITKKLNPIKENITSLVLDHYPATGAKWDPEWQMTSMITDIRARCPTDEVLNITSQAFVSPIYRYVLNAEPSKEIIQAFLKYHAYKFHPKYAFRRFSFYGFFGFPKLAFRKSTPNKKFVAHKMRHIVKKFIKTSKPPFESWKPFPNCTASIGNPLTQTHVQPQYKPERCLFWKDHGFFPKYAWHA